MRSAPGSAERGGVGAGGGGGGSDVSSLCLVPPRSAITDTVSPSPAGAEGTRRWAQNAQGTLAG